MFVTPLIVAGGLGTRMFPVSAIQPKETLPLVDVPLLTHLVMEAKNAGATRLHIILSPRKNLGDFLADRSDLATMRPELDASLFNITKDIEVFTHIQHEAKGIGNALQCALHAVEGPMLVLLGDNVLMDIHSPTTAFASSTASRRLVETIQRARASNRWIDGSSRGPSEPLRDCFNDRERYHRNG